MTASTHHRYLVPAWGFSLVLHSVVVALAMLFAAQVRPVLQEEPFKWDVSLVESPEMPPAPEPVPAPMKSVAAAVPSTPRVVPPRPVESPSEAVMHRVAPQQTVQMVHPEVQPSKPVEKREEPAPKIEPVTPSAMTSEQRTVEPAEQHLAESPKIRPESLLTHEREPQQAAESAVVQREPSMPSPAEAVDSRPVETPPTPPVLEGVASSPQVEPAPVVEAPRAAPQEAVVQTAKAAPGPEVKRDHRWLAESLWRRVAELKRYPSSARLNGQEGKVILKAVIRSDGHLAEVTVQKSSGHQILDAAAIEAVRLACPLHMKHAINKPEIVVSLPIVYSLAN